MSRNLHADTFYDAGHTGCGELVMYLRARMNELPPRGILQLIAHDPGAIEDLPAWCRLTGHELLRAEHPNYWLRRRKEA